MISFPRSESFRLVDAIRAESSITGKRGQV